MIHDLGDERQVRTKTWHINLDRSVSKSLGDFRGRIYDEEPRFPVEVSAL